MFSSLCDGLKQAAVQVSLGEYLTLLDKEIELQGDLFDHDREVIQLHFGGGLKRKMDSFLAYLHRLSIAQHNVWLRRFFNCEKRDI